MSLLPPNATPSDAAAADLAERLRHHTVSLHVAGTLVAAPNAGPRHYFGKPCRILGISSFRRSAGAGAGAGGATVVDVNLNGASLLTATMNHNNLQDGNNSRKLGTLNTAHARWDGYGIAIQAGDYLDVDIDAIEAGATAPADVHVQVEILKG